MGVGVLPPGEGPQDLLAADEPGRPRPPPERPAARRLGVGELAVEQLSIEAEVVKVTDYAEIMAYSVMSTPGLVIDGALVWRGGVPAVDKLKELITAKATARP